MVDERTQGDVRFYLTQEGMDIDLTGGQPNMVQGLANAVIISLLTEDNWPGAALLQPNERPTGNFMRESQKAITVSMLARAESAARKDLQWMVDDGLAKSVDVRVYAPAATRLNLDVVVTPPNSDPEAFQFSRYAGSWTSQKTDSEAQNGN